MATLLLHGTALLLLTRHPSPPTHLQSPPASFEAVTVSRLSAAISSLRRDGVGALMRRIAAPVLVFVLIAVSPRPSSDLARALHW